MKKNKEANYIIRDAGIIALSVILALVLAKTDAVSGLFLVAQGMRFIDSFIAGVFFISMFTVTPAAVILAKLAQNYSLLEVAFFGGLGAAAGDFIIFYFTKKNLTQSAGFLFKEAIGKKLSYIMHSQMFCWLLPLLGAVIIASPFPDELGLALMGVSRLRIAIFLPLVFALNFCGILILGMAARSLM